MVLWYWWEQAGSPADRATGFVFPSRRGDRIGEAKIKVSDARAFRRDLRRAWGIEAWDATTAAFVKSASPTSANASYSRATRGRCP